MKTKKPRMAKITVKALAALKARLAKVVKFNKASIQKIRELTELLNARPYNVSAELVSIPEYEQRLEDYRIKVANLQAEIDVFNAPSLPVGNIARVTLVENTGQIKVDTFGRDAIIKFPAEAYGLNGRGSAALDSREFALFVMGQQDLVYVDRSTNQSIALTHLEAMESFRGICKFGRYFLFKMPTDKAQAFSMEQEPGLPPKPHEVVKESLSKRVAKALGFNGQ